MNKQTWTWIVLVIVVIGIIWLVVGRQEEVVDTDTELDDTATTTEETNQDAPVTSTSKTQTPKKTVSYTDPNPAPVSYTNTNTNTQSNIHSVTYLESGGYLPKTTKVKVGDIVKFTNSGTNQMWTISADYPGHGTNNCGTASEYVIFDQCRIGSTYSFVMGVRGVWTYYNKQAPHHQGTIIVE